MEAEAASISSAGAFDWRYVLPLLAIIPCLAGGLVNAAVGRMALTILSIGAGMGVLMGNILLLSLKAPEGLHAAFMVSAALAGGLPALRYLKANRAEGEARGSGKGKEKCAASA